MKAQTVKNAVIVPVGAKGGFYVKRGDSKAAYQTFIRGLLELTDNRVTDASGRAQVVPPPDVVRRDGDDSYLVVAADKGTGAFSDVANALAEEYGYWLGDAFASGGSAGFDHKEMGITSRGAWLSVKAHFRAVDIDANTARLTVVGIGDMSGDVFGNGLLRSPHVQLVAAFDHRHVFVDPDPIRRRRSRNGGACSSCRPPRGPTTTPRCSRRVAACTRARRSRSTCRTPPAACSASATSTVLLPSRPTRW